MVDLVTNPLQSTSTGHTLTFHPDPSASAARSAFCSFLLSKASSVESSHGTVSSTIKTEEFNHGTRLRDQVRTQVGLCNLRWEGESLMLIYLHLPVSGF